MVGGAVVSSGADAVGVGVSVEATVTIVGVAGSTVPVSSGGAAPLAGRVAGVASPSRGGASARRPTNPAISGGRIGAANPQTKSTMQATTPAPMQPLKIRSPSIGSCDGPFLGMKVATAAGDESVAEPERYFIRAALTIGYTAPIRGS